MKRELHVPFVPFGCEPCPHKKQCLVRPCCLKDKKIIAKWAKTNPIMFNMRETIVNVEFGNIIASHNAAKKCPFCRNSTIN